MCSSVMCLAQDHGNTWHGMKASSSIGRALVSKTSGCGFKSCLACKVVAQLATKVVAQLATKVVAQLATKVVAQLATIEQRRPPSPGGNPYGSVCEAAF